MKQHASMALSSARAPFEALLSPVDREVPEHPAPVGLNWVVLRSPTKQLQRVSRCIGSRLVWLDQAHLPQMRAHQTPLHRLYTPVSKTDLASGRQQEHLSFQLLMSVHMGPGRSRRLSLERSGAGVAPRSLESFQERIRRSSSASSSTRVFNGSATIASIVIAALIDGDRFAGSPLRTEAG